MFFFNKWNIILIKIISEYYLCKMLDNGNKNKQYCNKIIHLWQCDAIHFYKIAKNTWNTLVIILHFKNVNYTYSLKDIYRWNSIKFLTRFLFWMFKMFKMHITKVCTILIHFKWDQIFPISFLIENLNLQIYNNIYFPIYIAI